MNAESGLFIVMRLTIAFFLVWALRPHNYSYYESLRLGVLVVSAFGIYSSLRWERQGWAWVFGFLAVLFNPFVKVALNRTTWNVVDVIVAAVLCASTFLLKPPPRVNQ
jgi:hypothetical protein